MTEFFNNLILRFFDFFGIGMIPKFTKSLAALIALLLVLAIPNDFRHNILILFVLTSVVFIIVFFDRYNLIKSDKNVAVISIVIGVWISCLSPFVYLTFEWMIILWAMYLILSNWKYPIKFTMNIKLGWLRYLGFDLIIGVIVLICFNLLYAGLNLLPLVILYIKK